MFVKYSFSVLEEAAGTWSVQNGHNSVLFCGSEASTREEPGWVGHVRGEAITQDRTVLLRHCAAEKGLWILHTDRMLWFLPFSWKNGKSKPESSFEYLPLRKVLGLSDLAVTKHLLLTASASGPCRDVWLCTSFMSGCPTPEPGLQFPYWFWISDGRTPILSPHCLLCSLQLCIFVSIPSLLQS